MSTDEKNSSSVKAAPDEPSGGGNSSKPFCGGCLCGRIKFVASPPKLFSVVCHCTICQRLGSANGSALVGFSGKSLNLTEGSDHLDSYDTSEGMTRFRCRTCGSSVYNQSNVLDLDFRDTPLANFERGADGIILRLDELRPTAHIFAAHRTPGIVAADPPGIVKFLGHAGQSEKTDACP